MLASLFYSFAPLIAQAADAAVEGQENWSSGLIQLVPLIAIPILAYYMLFMPEKQRQARLNRLQAVKEKDHVVTNGGIHGVITNIQREQGRATLRIDEASGTKIKIELSAIARVVTDENAATGESK
jgi:preprotein translocase subunit YajC